jgi:hypothetical protein
MAKRLLEEETKKILLYGFYGEISTRRWKIEKLERDKKENKI